MGEFAHHLQMKTDRTVEEVSKIVENVMLTNGYQCCSSIENQRGIAIIKRGNWVCIIDENTDDENLPAQLSFCSSFPCVAFDFVDSICMQAILYENGRIVDLFLTPPEVLDLERDETNCGHSEKWQIVTEKTDDLKNLFEEDDGAEYTLYEMAEILGIDKEVVVIQYSYLPDCDFEDIEHLYFCRI